MNPHTSTVTTTTPSLAAILDGARSPSGLPYWFASVAKTSSVEALMEVIPRDMPEEEWRALRSVAHSRAQDADLGGDASNDGWGAHPRREHSDKGEGPQLTEELVAMVRTRQLDLSPAPVGPNEHYSMAREAFIAAGLDPDSPADWFKAWRPFHAGTVGHRWCDPQYNCEGVGA